MTNGEAVFIGVLEGLQLLTSLLSQAQQVSQMIQNAQSQGRDLTSVELAIIDKNLADARTQAQTAIDNAVLREVNKK